MLAGHGPGADRDQQHRRAMPRSSRGPSLPTRPRRWPPPPRPSRRPANARIDRRGRQRASPSSPRAPTKLDQLPDHLERHRQGRLAAPPRRLERFIAANEDDFQPAAGQLPRGVAEAQRRPSTRRPRRRLRTGSTSSPRPPRGSTRASPTSHPVLKDLGTRPPRPFRRPTSARPSAG